MNIEDWIIHPFLDEDYDNLIPAIEEELTSLKHAIELKLKLTKSYQSFW